MRTTQVSGRLDYMISSSSQGWLSVCASLILLLLLTILFGNIVDDFRATPRSEPLSVPHLPT